jgi:hypothetical protein
VSELHKAAEMALEELEYIRYGDQFRKTIDTLRAALAQPDPEPEPVAWMSTNKAWMWSNKDKIPERWTGDVIPLYARPPQRKPLTEEEIRNAINTFKTAKNLMGMNHIHVARAIEKAHGIGGEG